MHFGVESAFFFSKKNRKKHFFLKKEAKTFVH